MSQGAEVAFKQFLIILQLSLQTTVLTNSLIIVCVRP